MRGKLDFTASASDGVRICIREIENFHQQRKQSAQADNLFKVLKCNLFSLSFSSAAQRMGVLIQEKRKEAVAK
jgi:hypothetical protein